MEIEKVEVDMRYLAPWFEKQLSYVYQYDLVHVFEGYRTLKSNINNLLSLSATCRRSVGLLPATQSTRVVKICDQIDALLSIETGYTLRDNCFITQSDIEFLKTLRSKLKIIDEMASSSRLSKSTGFEATGKDIRNLIHLVVESVDLLEFTLCQQSHLISHFTHLRETLHRPVASLITSTSRMLQPELENGLEARRSAVNEMQRLEDEVAHLKSSASIKEVARIHTVVRELAVCISTAVAPLAAAVQQLGTRQPHTDPDLVALSIALTQASAAGTLQDRDWTAVLMSSIPTLRLKLSQDKSKEKSDLKRALQAVDFEYLQALIEDSNDVVALLESSAASSEVLKVTADIQSSSRRLDVLKAGYSADRSVLKDLLAQFAALKDITREVCCMEIKVVVEVLMSPDLSQLCHIYQ